MKVVADTGGLLQALAADALGNPSFPAYRDVLVRASVVIVPVLVLAEVDYFLRHERLAMQKLVAELLDPSTTYELEPVFAPDIARALAIDAKFASLELGLVDGMVAAVAERRNVLRVLTTDRRDFTVVRVGTRFDKRLVLVP